MAVPVEDSLSSLGDSSLEMPAVDLSEQALSEIVTNVDAALAPTASDPNNDDDHRATLEIGHDGDDGTVGCDQPIADMLDSGHGFLVRQVEAPPRTDWRTSCELCGSAIAAPASGWVCELGSPPGTPAWDECGCNWCLLRGQWLRGEYRPSGGRPAKRCNTAECKKTAARERKRRQRERDRRGVTETPQQVEA